MTAGTTKLTMRLPDGRLVPVRKRAHAGSTKRVVYVEPRSIRKVIVPLRHSAANGRDEADDAQDHFLAPQTDLEDCVRKCKVEGWEWLSGSSWNFDGDPG